MHNFKQIFDHLDAGVCAPANLRMLAMLVLSIILVVQALPLRTHACNHAHTHAHINNRRSVCLFSSVFVSPLLSAAGKSIDVRRRPVSAS